MTASSQVVVDFRLRVKVPVGYLPCIVGSCEELGSWDPLNAKVMQRCNMNDQEWHKRITFKRNTLPYFYRFFVCKPLPESLQMKRKTPDNKVISLDQQPGIIIHKWESQVECRSINTSELTPYYVLPMTDFDWAIDHQQIWFNDWLLNVTEIRVRVVGNTAVRFFDGGHRYGTIGIKCCPIDFKDIVRNNNIRDSKLGPAVTNNPVMSRFLATSAIPVSSFRKLLGPRGIAESMEHHWQKSYVSSDVTVFKFDVRNNMELVFYHSNTVVPFNNGEFLCFHVCTITQETQGFRFEFYSDQNGHQKFIGVAFLLPLEKGLSFKLMKIPIFGLDTRCIGELITSCLVIRPILDLKMDMKISFQNHWKYRRQPGIGSSSDTAFTYVTQRILSMKENTLASLTAASFSGVDFIEFSVQLCQDKVPVIYHDFHVLVKSYNKLCKACEVYKTLVKDLTSLKLQSATLKKYSKIIDSLPSAAVRNYNDFEPFLNLSHALLAADPSIGFLIVVKYPQTLVDGRMEIEDYFDQNMVADIIISTVLKSNIKRKIVFTSLDADTCILLQKKQNKYPVLYRSKALNSSSIPEYDFRYKSMDAAISFAVSEKLLGVDLLAEELCNNLAIIKKAHVAGLIVFVWSDDPNFNAEICRHQVDALVSDYIQFNLGPGVEKEVFLLSNQKEEIDLLKARVMTGIARDEIQRLCRDIRPYVKKSCQ